MMYSFKQNSNNFLASLQCNHANFLCLHYDRCEAVMRYDGIHGSGKELNKVKNLWEKHSQLHTHTHTQSYGGLTQTTTEQPLVPMTCCRLAHKHLETTGKKSRHWGMTHSAIDKLTNKLQHTNIQSVLFMATFMHLGRLNEPSGHQR